MRRSLGILALVLVTGCGSTVQVTGSGQTGSLQGDGLSLPGSGQPTAGTNAQLPSSVGPTGSGSTTIAGPGIASAGGGATSLAGGPIPSAAAAGPIPVAGPGWTRTTVTIGVMTQQDVQKVAESAGINSVDSGDQVADVNAVIKHINARGGLFGRQVRADIYDIKTAGEPEAQGQAACAHFTKDARAVAVYAMALVGDTESFRACMHKAKVPVLAGGGQAFDEKVFRDLAGYYTLMPFPSYDRFVPYFLDRLVAQGFFSPWDPSLGRPGTVKDKDGFLCPDTAIGHRVGAIIVREMQRVGHPAASQIYYSTNSADVSGYVLRMKADGITHVLFCDLGLAVFMLQAETQGYRPRYGVSSFNTPSLFLEPVAPDAQLVGSMGSGFMPTLDVNASNDPTVRELPSGAACEAIARSDGLSYDHNRRLAVGILYDTCDILQLVVASAKAATALDGPGLVRGLAIAGPTWRPALTWRSGLSGTVHGMPTAARDLYYEVGCKCYRYRGPTTAF